MRQFINLKFTQDISYARHAFILFAGNLWSGFFLRSHDHAAKLNDLKISHIFRTECLPVKDISPIRSTTNTMAKYSTIYRGGTIDIRISCIPNRTATMLCNAMRKISILYMTLFFASCFISSYLLNNFLYITNDVSQFPTHATTPRSIKQGLSTQYPPHRNF